MGRLTERVTGKIAEQVRPHLLPAERVKALALGAEDKPRRRFWAGLISPFAQAFAEWPYFIVVTDQRFLALKPSLTGKSAGLAIAEPLSTLSVDRFKHGPLRTLLVVRTEASRQPLRFTFGPGWRSSADAIRAALAGDESLKN